MVMRLIVFTLFTNRNLRVILSFDRTLTLLYMHRGISTSVYFVLLISVRELEYF